MTVAGPPPGRRRVERRVRPPRPPARATAPLMVNNEVPGSSSDAGSAEPFRAVAAPPGPPVPASRRSAPGRPAVDAGLGDATEGSRGKGRPTVSSADESGLLTCDEPPSSWAHLHRAPPQRRAWPDLRPSRVRSPGRRAAPATPGRAISRPSSTRCGLRAEQDGVLALRGSPSIALPTTTGRRRPAATALTLVAVGKPPPPRPVSPLRSISWSSASRARVGRAP